MKKRNWETQQQKVLNYIQNNKKGITSMFAFWRFGITRLSGHIYELRKKGYNICTKKEPNKFSDGYHGRYVYLGTEKEWWKYESFI